MSVNMMRVNFPDSPPQMMVAMGERLRAARKKMGISGSEAARRLGMKASTYLAHENGQNEFDMDAAVKYARLFKVDPVWLLRGHQSRESLIRSFDPDEPDHTAADEAPTFGTETGVRGIPEDASAQLDLTGGLGSGGLSIVSEGVPGRRGMTFAADQIRDYWRLPQAILGALGLRAHDVAIIPVQGDSMLPTLNEGDVVFIDTRHRWPSPPGLYAILDEIGGVVVKRLEISSPPGAEQQMVSIISDNPRHIRKEWRAEDVHIIGRVMRKFGVVA